ncbi:RcpC/CpaB family pilus assembly protein [Streptomyces coryli]|uniref:RcpC/CpaB family pilus assembly protein n=1 Tax=Streptomyces coryli TaxID=1128680 RepID=UPI003B82EA2D
MAAGLAISAAALAAAAPRGGDARLTAAEPAGQATAAPHPKPGARAGHALVAAPVRIADAASVRLLRPGDRVDVVAAGGGAAGDRAAKVVARAARVAQVPRGDGAASGTGPDLTAEAGALVVLSVPRPTAAALAGAAASGRLAVSLC